MDLDRLVALAEIINAVAVTLTLLFLIVSIRQNTRSQKALAVDSLAAASAMAHYFLFSYFKLSESAWYQQNADILEVGHWQGWENGTRKFYHSKGVREVWWPARRHSYSAEFQAFPAGTVPADEIGSLKDIFDYQPRVA
jgi:hypothetical protein